MRYGTALVRPKVGRGRPVMVQVVHLETDQDLHDLRQNTEWHGGQMRLLKYKTLPPQGFLPGVRFLAGAYITKTEDGQFGFLKDPKGFTPTS